MYKSIYRLNKEKEAYEKKALGVVLLAYGIILIVVALSLNIKLQ